jgi:hypothetical protein
MRELAMALAGIALMLAVSGCESTESESARLGREGAKLIAGAGTVGLGASNQAVHVGQVALVQGEGRTAAAVQLTDTGALPQVNVPVLIDVLDPKGASVYRNNLQGLEPSLQEMPLLRSHQSSWWVDDQVLAAGTPRSLQVRVGAAKGATESGAAGEAGSAARVAGNGGSLAGAAAASAGVQASVVSLGSDIGGPYLNGDLSNRSGVAQHNMPIFAVALRGARVVAAGRALVPSLPAFTGAHPTSFRIYLVGSPAGAHIELTPAPAVQD